MNQETRELVLLILALVFGFYMAWSIGANDVANAMGTSVGSGALTLKRAVIVAAVLEFSGALLVGMHVSETVRKGIIDPEVFSAVPMLFIYGMLAALLSAAIWLQIASFYGWPVSTTHSIVGSILGFGVVVGGVECVYWSKVLSIVASWVVSPLTSGIISFLIFTLIRRTIFHAPKPVEAAKKLTPFLVFAVFFILTLVLVFKGLKNLHLDLSFQHSIAVGILVGISAAIVSYFLMLRIKIQPDIEERQEEDTTQLEMNFEKSLKHLHNLQEFSTGAINKEISKVVNKVSELKGLIQSKPSTRDDDIEYRTVEKIFIYLQILSACFVAFAHGANDVANAIGPLSAIFAVLKTNTVELNAAVPIWILGLGGIGIVIGLATWGWRVIETVGKRITELTPSRGFAAEFGAATTIVVASKLGLPISTTHTLVGAVLGVGVARGMNALNLTTIRDIIISWLVTIPVGAFLTIILFYIFKFIFA